MLLKNKIHKITFCGVTTSLCLTVMLLTNVVPGMSYSFPAIAGIFLICIVIDVGVNWAWAVFFCAAVISFFTVTDKEASLMFIMFFGYYPILKRSIESIRIKVIQFIIKLVFFNVVCVTEFFIAKNFLLLPTDSFSVFGISAAGVLLFFANITFIIYDFAVSTIVYRYIIQIRPKLKSMIN